MRTRLNQELVPPAIECFKRLGTVHVIDEDTTVCATVKCYAEGLETFLSGSVP